MNVKPHFTSARTGDGDDTWTTPPELVEAAQSLLGWSFVLDTACDSHNVIHTASIGLAHDLGHDGLRQDWAALVPHWERYSEKAAAWCNPPYSTATDWLRKAHHAGCRVAVLIPARTDTAWWHDHVMRSDGVRAVQAVYLLRGRVAFGTGGQSAPFPSALVVYDPDVEGDACRVVGWDWKREMQAALPLGG